MSAFTALLTCGKGDRIKNKEKGGKKNKNPKKKAQPSH